MNARTPSVPWSLHGKNYDARIVYAALATDDDRARTLSSEAIAHAIDEWLGDWACQVPLKDVLLVCRDFHSWGYDLLPGSKLHAPARRALRALFLGDDLAAIDTRIPPARSQGGMRMELRLWTAAPDGESR